MFDLNAVLFYKSKFNVRASDPSYDLLWEFVWLIKSWISSKYPSDPVIKNNTIWSDFKLGNNRIQSLDEKTLYADSIYFTTDETHIYWACRIIESPLPLPGFAPRKWTTELGFVQTSKGTAEISCVLSYEDTPKFIGPCEDPPCLSFPKLMKYMLKSDRINCFICEDDLSIEPTLLQAGEYKSFFENRLWSSNRKIPYLLVCPIRDEEGNVKLPIDLKELLVAVAMNAIIFYADDMSFQSEMKYFIHPDYLCYPGSIRLYMPNMNPSVPFDYTRHRYLTARNIEEYSEKVVYRIFRRALAQDMHSNESLFRIGDCRELKIEFRYQQKLEKIREVAEAEKFTGILAAKAEANEDALDDLLELSEKKDKLEHDNHVLKTEIRELKTEIFGLRSQLDSLQDVAQKCKAAQLSFDMRRCLSELPNTPQDVAKYFCNTFVDRIAFSEKGLKSLKSCYTQTNLLWNALYEMCTTLYDLYFVEGDPIYNKTFQDRTGWECSRGEGSSTRKDATLMKQYQDTFEGREINIEAHIKNGTNETDPKFIRIYFGFDTFSSRIIIGSCGKHKENATSRKVK